MRIVAILFALLIGGCNQHIIRDTAVYETELQFSSKIVNSSATLLEKFWERKCGCLQGKWTAYPGAGLTRKECEEAATISLLVKTNRWEWHVLMSKLNAGWDTSELKLPTWFDAKNPPSLPTVDSLCEAQ